MDAENKFKKDQVVIFDLCGTLYDSNTTFEFLDTYIYPVSKYYRIVRKITRLTIWRAFNKILFRFFSLDPTRFLAIKSLRKIEKKWLEDKARVFFSETLIRKQFEIPHRLLQQAQKAGSKIILVSASLDFIVAEAAAVLNIETFHASSLGYEGKICTGVLTNDLLGKKELIRFSDNMQLENAIVITDNVSDLKLVKKAAFAYIVSDQNHRRYWQGLENINMIYV